jgi:ABC-type glycerol-3-phosphate transport system permease component
MATAILAMLPPVLVVVGMQTALRQGPGRKREMNSHGDVKR